MTCGFLGKFTTCELGGLDYQVILIVFFLPQMHTETHRVKFIICENLRSICGYLF